MNVKFRKAVIPSILALVISALALLGAMNFVKSADEGGAAFSESVKGSALLATQETIEQALAKGERLPIITKGSTTYENLVYGTANHANISSEAGSLADGFFWKISKKDIEIVKATDNSPTANVITYGRVANVPLSVRLADAVDAFGTDSISYGIAYENGVIAIYSNSKAGLNAEKSILADKHKLYDDVYVTLEKCISDGAFSVPNGLFYVYSLSKADLEQLKAEDELAYEAERQLIREERKQQLPGLIAALDNSEFAPLGGSYTANLYSKTSKRYAAPEKYPTTGEHPRVYFNSSMIPGIKAAMEDPANAVAVVKFWDQANEWITGELGPRVKKSGSSHNHNGEILDKIQAKAFAYVLTGDTYYGHGAIYAMENYLRTLDYDGRSSDQCRDFGQIMYITACVYDWCHDLLTETDVYRLVTGVEQILCTGNVKNEDKTINIASSTVKMEVGFPPVNQGAVTGHGAEDQILRDYLSFAIAIFDEVPGWYELIGGRFYEQYVDIRNAYYTAGLVPQGTGGYNTGRYQSDLHSAVLMLAATGEIPYNAEDMREVAYGLLVPLTNPDANIHNVFYIGDCRPHQTPRFQLGLTVPLISSYLFDDPLMRGVANWISPGLNTFSSAEAGVSACEYFIYSSRGTKTVADPFEELPLVTYNGGWYGQIISRNKWGDGAAVVLMKVQEKTTANHDHMAAGAFQIYYKGILTGDMGDYTGVAYGSPHCNWFLRGTVSHNGLLIYNPALKSSNSGYYSGGQRQNVGEPSHTSWFSNSGYNTGTVTGYKYAYDNSMNPTFAYIAGDITEAYDAETVDYVGRTMLTVYTDDPKMPAVFFVFDNISADSADFRKTFLLQVPGEQAPIVDRDNKMITVTNGKGKLVLENILGGDVFTEWGGNDPTKEAPYNRLNYVINGQQLHYYGSSWNYKNTPEKLVPDDGESWGRVEISPNTGNKTDYMLNVMYVADDDATVTLRPEGFKAYNTKDSSVLFEGAKFGNIAALFAKTEKNTTEQFKFTIPGEGLSELYVGGLYKGTWKVSVDGKKVGTIYSTGEAAMVNFKAYAGTEITFTPGDDIRPANSGEVHFNLDGGSWVNTKPPFEFYPLGQETLLPDASMITKNDCTFQGWYTDAEYTNKITSIPSDAGDVFTVYAKWKQNPTVNYADYSQGSDDTRIDISPQAGLSSATQAQKDAATATYNDAGYMLWTSIAGGPSIFGTSNYKDYNSTVFSFEFVLSKNNSDPVLVTGLRMRNSAKKDITLFSTAADGTVSVGNTIIGKLGSSPVSIRFTVDFAQGKIFYFSNEYGDEIHVKTFSDPDGNVSNTVDLIPLMLGNEIFSWRANGNGSSKGAIRIHKISVMCEEMFRQEASDEIIYNTNGGSFTDGTANNVPYDKVNGTTLSTAIKRDGYIFDGWYADEGFSTKVESVPAGQTGAFPVFAKWVRHEIVYETNGGSFGTAPETLYTPGTARPLPTDITKADHSFLGWYTTSDFTEGTRVTELPATATDAFYVYAKWVKNTVIYNTNGGSFANMPADTYVPGAENLLPTDITNGEFVFGGWYTDPEFSAASRVESIPTDKVGEFEVWAKWTLEGNRIYYILNDGAFDGTYNTDYSVSRELSTNVKREGYSFLGWHTDPECTTRVTTVPEGYEGAFIVYAKWFKTVVLHDTMDELGANAAYNYVECTNHSDTDNNGICEVCKVCTDIATCNDGGKKSTCAKCGRAWSTERPGIKISDATGKMELKHYAAAKFSKVDVDGDSALLVDIQYLKDDGITYLAGGVSKNMLKYFSDDNDNMLANEFVLSIDLAKLEGKNTPSFGIRMFTSRQEVLYVKDGKVYNKRGTTSENLITELTTDMQTIEVTFNIEKLASEGTVTYSVYSTAQGKTISRTISGTNATDAFFQWRYNASKNAAILIDDIKITVPSVND